MGMFREIQQRGMGKSLEILNEKGLTLPQVLTLHLLQEKGPCTVTEISECTKLSAGATSHLVDRLYIKKLLDRVENEQDRRQKQISLSNLGAITMDRLTRSRKEELMKPLETLSETTRVRFAEALTLVLDEIKSTKVEPTKEAIKSPA
jgi:Transcriptional regulators